MKRFIVLVLVVLFTAPALAWELQPFNTNLPTLQQYLSPQSRYEQQQRINQQQAESRRQQQLLEEMAANQRRLLNMQIQMQIQQEQQRNWDFISGRRTLP